MLVISNEESVSGSGMRADFRTVRFIVYCWGLRGFLCTEQPCRHCVAAVRSLEEKPGSWI